MIAADGQAIGEIAALFLDSDSWRVESLQVKLRNEVADQLGATRGMFHPGTLEMPIRMVQSVGDAVGVCQGDRSQHLMRPPRQLAEHIHRLRLIARLFKYLSIHNNRRVCCEHGQPLTRAPDRKRLLPREAGDIVTGSLPRQKCFVDVRAHNHVRHANLCQELAPPR